MIAQREVGMTTRALWTPELPWRELFDRLPESKLELINGRLVAGNGLAGSRSLLWAILHSLGPQAALPFAPLAHWWQALVQAFEAPRDLRSAHDWQRWSAACAYTPDVPLTHVSFSWPHHDAYQSLMLALYAATSDDDLGTCIQRFVMRLGDNGFQPDLQLIRRDRLHRLESYYTDGPADLVIEVVLEGSEAHDRDVKRHSYATGGVPEYWVVDPVARTTELLRLEQGFYVTQPLDADGRYRPISIPGLAFDPTALWAALDAPQGKYRYDKHIFVVENSAAPIGPSTRSNVREDWSWTWRPFDLPVEPYPTPISFDEYIAWCPEAKFEWLDGKPYIGGWQGTRDVLGLLLKSWGLVEAVRLLHPRDWVAGLSAEQEARARDVERRDAWWAQARQAAELLRERFGAERLAVVGDLVEPTPLHYWSEITLVSWARLQPDHEVYRALHEVGGNASIDLRYVERASPKQLDALLQHGILL